MTPRSIAVSRCLAALLKAKHDIHLWPLGFVSKIIQETTFEIEIRRAEHRYAKSLGK